MKSDGEPARQYRGTGDEIATRNLRVVHLEILTGWAQEEEPRGAFFIHIYVYQRESTFALCPSGGLRRDGGSRQHGQYSGQTTGYSTGNSPTGLQARQHHRVSRPKFWDLVLGFPRINAWHNWGNW